MVDMKLKRYYTDAKKHPFEMAKFIRRSARLDSNGKTHAVWAPQHWSQNAVDIVSMKYLRKTGVPNKTGIENDFRELFLRLAKCWSFWGKKQGVLTSASQAKIFEEEILYMLIFQMAAPNSPQWFNTGLYHHYKIKGAAQGHWYYDEKAQQARPSKDAYQRPQPHACFIQDVQDNLVGEKGVMELWTQEARLFKHGSGTGSNFSRLRSKGEPLSSGGESGGVLRFLKIGDQAAGAIKSGGTSRRAAKMVILDIDHPDVEEFIDWKKNEEKKVACLIAGSAQLKIIEKRVSKIVENSKRLPSLQELSDLDYEMQHRGLPTALREEIRLLVQRGQSWQAPAFSEDWQGEAYQSISAQNSNNSVRIPHSFMQKLTQDGLWSYKRRVDAKVVKRVKTCELWKKMSAAAWACADPGLQFSGTINEWHTCPKEGSIRASNPCSEYLFLDDTACNLASLNVLAFYDPKKDEFDFQGFEHAIHFWTLVLDISVGMAQYPTREIAERSHRYRTLGLGLTNMGAFFMSKALPYDSDRARSWGQLLCSFLGARAWLTSSELAEHLKPCPAWRSNKEDVLRVLNNHVLCAQNKKRGYVGLTVKPYLTPRFEDNKTAFGRAENLWQEALEKIRLKGVRNMQTTLLAPTGTISLVMDCDTTGVEPDYSFQKTKFLVGGSEMSLVNKSVYRALERLGYEGSKAHRIIHHAHERGSFQGAPGLKASHVKIFDCAQKDSCERRLSPMAHVLMVAAVQPFLCGSVSKTVNLPHDATIEEVSEIYYQAYHSMIKCIAIFREGSKLSWPLKSTSFKSLSEESSEFKFECPFCHTKSLIPTGTCFVCQGCGESTSCA